MYIMCIVCLGYLSFFPTSAIASVLCTCISMYNVCMEVPINNRHEVFIQCYIVNHSDHTWYMYMSFA